MKTQNPTPADVLDALDRRLQKIDARRAAATNEILALEGAGIVAQAAEPVPDVELEARKLLAGGGPFAIPDPSLGVRLFNLHREREFIDRALEIGRRESFRVSIEKAAAVIVAGDAEWRAIARRRALAIAEVRRTDGAATKLRERMTADAGGGVVVGLPVDSGLIPLFGAHQLRLEGFLARAIEAGVVTQKEVK